MVSINQILLLVGKLNYVWTNTESLFIYLIVHLVGTTKEVAIVIFLTLNTTRARLDLLERLANSSTTPASTREAVLGIVGRLKHESRVRNKYNHCVYSFDAQGELSSTQLMRIAQTKDDLRYGKVESLDDDEMGRIRAAIEKITAVNRDIWAFMAISHIDV